MTPRSFFTIVLKLAGLWLLIMGIQVVMQFISTMASMLFPDSFDEGSLGFFSFVLLLLAGLYGFIVYCCIFRTDRIIDLLKLDKGFDEERFDFRIHRSDVLKIAVIVIGGLLLVDAIPHLCERVYGLLQERRIMQATPDAQRIGFAIFYVAQMLAGYFLMTGSRSVVNFIERNRRKK